MRLSYIPAALVLAASTLIAHADSVYTYTGRDFTDVFGDITMSDSDSGSFSTTSPLADNLNTQYFTPASFSFTSGTITLNNSTPGISEDFIVSTNASGAIVGWSIQTYDDFDEIEISDYAGGGSDYPQDPNGIGQNFLSGTFKSPTPSAVTPEPSTFALLGTGILGLAGMARRKFLPQS